MLKVEIKCDLIMYTTRCKFFSVSRSLCKMSVAMGVLWVGFGGLSLAGSPGQMTYEVWNGVPGSQVKDLTGLPRFHGGPDSVTLVNGSLAPSNVGSNYGSRLRGYVIAPVTGDYTFWESGDDAVELWFSQDSSKFNKELIAWHTGWTGSQQWDKYESQRSETMRLQAGQKCYVELRHKEGSGGDNLALAWAYNEVQPSMNLTQLAGVVASQSSQWGDKVAENAIDGLTSPADGNNHTQNQAGAWWQVDLGSERSVDRIKLWNIESWYNMRRLSNYRVLLLNANGVEVISKDFHTDGTYSGPTEEWLLEGAVNASVVRVEKLGPGFNGTHILHMAEVEVFGVEAPQPQVNFAQLDGVMPSQSSTYGSWVAEYAIDGNTGGDVYAGDQITHTKSIAGSWWQIELGEARAIEQIVLWNREDWNGRRLANFRVSILDASGTAISFKDFYTDGTHAGQTVVWDLDAVVRARTVRIERIGPSLWGENILTLAEVQVFGSLDRLANVSRQLVDVSALESYDLDPADLDDDDLLDAWELAHGFDPSTWQDGDFTYDADSDTDYLSNFDESQLGFDPFSPDSLPGYMTLEQRRGIDHYSVREAAAQSDKIYQDADDTFLVPGASTGEQYRWFFAQRMRGYITAPETGAYRFWVSGTNGVQLLLSSDDGKFRKRLIAELGPEVGTGHGRNFYAEDFKWDLYVSQMSEEIQLEAGQKYFLEVLHQHGHGHYPHASVAWARPGAGREAMPAEFTSTYFPVAGDADDDSLLDTWEQQYGLSVTDNGLVDRSREGENGDFDGDGLNNRDEYITGTNPANADTDGDGLTDADELRSYHTNPLVSDAPAESIASTINLDTHFDADGGWGIIDGGLVSDTFRGSISWNFSVPVSGAWIVHVDTRLRGAVYANEKVPVNTLIDGKFSGRYTLHYGASHHAIIRIPVLDLSAGNHTLTLEIDNILGRRMVQIDSISLRQPSGMDLDNNGTPDWISETLAQTDFVKEHATTSRVSPFFMEGGARNRADSLLNGQPVLPGKGTEHWYANLPLVTGVTYPYVMDFANGEQTHGSVFWWSTNVLDNETLTIRKGDSLRLGAWVGSGNGANTEHPNKPNSQGNGVVSTITVEGVDHILGNSRDTYDHQFNTPGTYEVTATHVSGATGMLTVTVRDASLPDETTVVQNTVSFWDLQDAQVARDLFFESGKGLNLGQYEEIDDANYRFQLNPVEGGHFGVIVRLWEDGPILDVASITSVTVTDALQNDLTTSFNDQEFPGYYRLTTPLVVLDLPPGGKVVVTVYRAGVTFPDGTKQKTYFYDDFTNGLATLEFLLPVGMPGGYCHNISVYDANGTLIGHR